MRTADERLATLEEQVRGLREDAVAAVGELRDVRRRLHDVEGVTGMYVATQTENRRKEAEQYRRLELRIQVLSLAIACAAIVVPIAVLILSRR